MTLFLVQVVVPWQFTGAMKALSIAVNMLLSPFNYMSVPLFIYGGTFVLGGIKCDPITIFNKFQDPKISFLGAIGDSSSCIFGGVLVWALIGVPVVYLMTVFVSYFTSIRDETRRKSSHDSQINLHEGPSGGLNV
jgi:hypothetical protein